MWTSFINWFEKSVLRTASTFISSRSSGYFSRKYDVKPHPFLWVKMSYNPGPIVGCHLHFAAERPHLTAMAPWYSNSGILQALQNHTLVSLNQVCSYIWPGDQVQYWRAVKRLNVAVFRDTHHLTNSKIVDRPAQCETFGITNGSPSIGHVDLVSQKVEI